MAIRHERGLTFVAGRRDTTQRTSRCRHISSDHQVEGPANLAPGRGEGKALRGHGPDGLSEPLQQETILNVLFLNPLFEKSSQHEEGGYGGVELPRRHPQSALGAHLTCSATAGGPRQLSTSCNKPLVGQSQDSPRKGQGDYQKCKKAPKRHASERARPL